MLWLAILAVAGAAGWFYFSRTVPAVETVLPERGVAVDAVYATGTVEPTVMMPIAPRVAARLVELNADEGAGVSKGQVLARLEDDDLQKSLEELKARLDFARKDYERRAALAKEGIESKAALDQARANFEAAQAAAGKAAAQADFMKLVAPEDGMIIRRDGEVGQMISVNQPVFWLSCCAPLRVSAEVDEEDIAQVKPGLDVVMRADAFPGRVFRGRVQAVTPKGDPVARSYRVRVEFTEGENPLRIGMTAEVNIILAERKDALLLPTRAVGKDGKIWLVRGGKLEEKKVSLGARGPEKTEITEGLSPEDPVVLKPKDDFSPGMRVRAGLKP